MAALLRIKIAFLAFVGPRCSGFVARSAYRPFPAALRQQLAGRAARWDNASVNASHVNHANLLLVERAARRRQAGDNANATGSELPAAQRSQAGDNATGRVLPMEGSINSPATYGSNLSNLTARWLTGPLGWGVGTAKGQARFNALDEMLKMHTLTALVGIGRRAGNVSVAPRSLVLLGGNSSSHTGWREVPPTLLKVAGSAIPTARLQTHENFMQLVEDWIILFMVSGLVGIFFYSPGRVATRSKVPDPEDTFLHGHFDCLSDPDTAVCAFACPWLRWSDTVHMLDYMDFWTAFVVFAVVTLMEYWSGILPALLLLYHRQKLRQSLDLPNMNVATVCLDFWFACLCPCCLIAQEARVANEAFIVGKVGQAVRIGAPLVTGPVARSAPSTVASPKMSQSVESSSLDMSSTRFIAAAATALAGNGGGNGTGGSIDASQGGSSGFYTPGGSGPACEPVPLSTPAPNSLATPQTSRNVVNVPTGSGHASSSHTVPLQRLPPTAGRWMAISVRDGNTPAAPDAAEPKARQRTQPRDQ